MEQAYRTFLPGPPAIHTYMLTTRLAWKRPALSEPGTWTEPGPEPFFNHEKRATQDWAVRYSLAYLSYASWSELHDRHNVMEFLLRIFPGKDRLMLLLGYPFYILL